MGFEVIDAGKENPIEKVKELTDWNWSRRSNYRKLELHQPINKLFEMVKDMDGRILFFAAGYPAPELEIDSNVIHYRRLEMIGTYAADTIDFLLQEIC